jgi:hypothetical protein
MHTWNSDKITTDGMLRLYSPVRFEIENDVINEAFLENNIKDKIPKDKYTRTIENCIRMIYSIDKVGKLLKGEGRSYDVIVRTRPDFRLDPNSKLPRVDANTFYVFRPSPVVDDNFMMGDMPTMNKFFKEIWEFTAPGSEGTPPKYWFGGHALIAAYLKQQVNPVVYIPAKVNTLWRNRSWGAQVDMMDTPLEPNLKRLGK